MPKYAYYDPGTAKVLGWIDTDLGPFPDMPSDDRLLIVTSDQWEARTTQLWAVVAGALVPYVPPPPPTLTPQQTAAGMMARPAPVAIQCTSIPALNGNYAIDAQTCSQITSIAAANAAGLGLPGGGATFNWPDATFGAHQWPAAQFMALAAAVMNYIYQVSQIAQGHSNTFPTLPLVIA